jgi:signal transduction histidine kinase/HAMP domain-containing protein
MNPSLTTRLRIGFAVLLVLLGGVTVLGVGRLFQLRQQFEDDSSRAFQLEVAAERMRSAFVLEQASVARFENEPRAARTAYRVAVAASMRTTTAARSIATGDPTATELIDKRAAAEEGWRHDVARPILRGRAPPRARQRRLAAKAAAPTVALSAHALQRRSQLRTDVSDATRHTLLLVLIGLGAAVLAATVFFFGLVNSMREPLAKLVAAAHRLAARDLGSRVEVSGPVEIATLGEAFNEMAGELQGAYARIEEVRNQLAVTVESLADGLLTVDDQSIVTQINPAGQALLPEAQIGADAGKLLEEPEDGSRLRGLMASRERGEVRTMMGRRVLSIVVAPLGGEQGAVLSIRDVSERARIEKLKDEFVATASHELRSPLTSVKGFAELLMLERDKLTPEAVQNAEIILQGTTHLVEVLNNLLDLARRDAGRLKVDPVPSQVEPLVEDVVRLLRPRLEEKRQELRVDIEPGIPDVLAEPARFKQVLGNLLTNAHDYTPEGGRIEVSANAVGNEIEIVVADNGPGIPEDKLEEVFDRFTRLDAGDAARVGGSGLGLAITKSLIELHGGAIGVTSTAGRGSIFRFVLPAALAPTVPGN